MRIGIDARFYGKAGPGRYTKSIVQHLEKIDIRNKYIIFLDKDGFEEYAPRNKNFTKVLADYTWYSFEEQTKLLWAVLKQKLDIYYVPHFNIPVLYPGKIVTAIPDMTMHKHSTRFSTTLPQWYFLFKKCVYKMVFWWAVLRSYKVIVPSKTVLMDFMKYLNFNESKYVVAYEGVDPDFFKTCSDPQKVLDKFNITKNFILYVGSMYEHKNVPRLIKMYKILKTKYNYDGQFVLVSKRDEFSRKIYEQVAADGYAGDIIFPAYSVEMPTKMIERSIVVSDGEIVALRQRASVYVIAALTEGFSLTALEGMIHGLPAVISDIDCHREVYGNSVMYFDPKNVKHMACQVDKMIGDKDLQRKYIKRGYEQVKKYDWTETAKITLAIFEETRH